MESCWNYRTIPVTLGRGLGTGQEEEHRDPEVGGGLQEAQRSGRLRLISPSQYREQPTEIEFQQDFHVPGFGRRISWNNHRTKYQAPHGFYFSPWTLAIHSHAIWHKIFAKLLCQDGG